MAAPTLLKHVCCTKGSSRRSHDTTCSDGSRSPLVRSLLSHLVLRCTQQHLYKTRTTPTSSSSVELSSFFLRLSSKRNKSHFSTHNLGQEPRYASTPAMTQGIQSDTTAHCSNRCLPIVPIPGALFSVFWRSESEMWKMDGEYGVSRFPNIKDARLPT